MIKKKNTNKAIEVDLTGPEGNAFVLLGYAHRWAKQMDLDWDEVEKELTSGDYEHLVATMDKYFGKVVTFYR